jgi:hypothetical protein
LPRNNGSDELEKPADKDLLVLHARSMGSP